MIQGLKVSNGPQLNTSLKLSFFHSKMWFADITLSYFDLNYLNYAPSRRMKGLYTGVRADGSSVNGWYGNVTDGKSQTGTVDIRNLDENGNVLFDKKTMSGLKYPYNLLDQQETLVDSKWYNRLMLDFSVGKLIYLPHQQSLSINLSVSNATNNTHMKTGGYQQARLPRQTIQGESNESNNSRIAPNAWKYPAKYYYAWGANFFFNMTYKF